LVTHFGVAATLKQKMPMAGPQCLVDCYDANGARKNLLRRIKISTNTFDGRCGDLLIQSSLSFVPHQHVSKGGFITRRFGLVRVLSFVLVGRGRMPGKTQLMDDWSCEPRISLFDPPMHVWANPDWTHASLGETRLRVESSAAAQYGLGHDIGLKRAVMRQPFAQVVPINPG
jgi:hypothetical protein